ncbi:MAG: barstar family protein [Clostridia bacterium]|nr:barstar family protein [Clostridia bacterium]MBQ4351186.1 barstar family protein [Clostridia bacterium]
MRYVILNGAAVTDRKTLYDALEAHLELPDYFGRNLDALHDVLGDLLAAQPLTLEIEGTETLLRTLGRYGEAFLHMLDDTAKENKSLRLTFR